MRRLEMTMLASVAAAVFVFAGCSSAETAIEKATGCEVDAGSDQASIECEDGKGSFSTGGSAEVPEDFPTADVPLPDGKLISAVATAINGDEGYNLSFTVSGSLADAATDYRKDLRSAGFAVDDSDSFSADGTSISGFSAEGNGWTVTVLGGGSDSKDVDAILSVTVVSEDDSGTTT